MKLNLAFCLLAMQQCHRVTKATHDHHQRQSHYKSLFNEVDREVNGLMVKFRNADRKSANNYGHIAFGIIKTTVVFPSVLVTVNVKILQCLERED